MKEINVCFVTDENYASYVEVVITSILENSNNDEYINFYIFDNDITEKTKLKLQKTKTLRHQNATIIFVNVNSASNEIKNLKQTIPHISKASYFKFVIADLLPNLNKIIYLDGDLIVKTSLYNLYNLELGNNLIAAVEDVGYTYWSKFNDKMKLKFKCINSGVMLINCELWRKENLSRKQIECSFNHDRVDFGQEQPVLNYVLKDRILFIPFVWNVQDTFFRDEIELENRSDTQDCMFAKKYPNIIHYTYIKNLEYRVCAKNMGLDIF